MSPADGVDVLGAGHEDAGADDIVEPGAGLGQCAGDDLEADPRLLVGIVWWIGVAGHDRCSSGNPHLSADADGARVADAVLERGTRRDPLAIHRGSVVVVDALRQVDGWPCQHVAVAVVSAAGLEAAHGDEDLPFAWASVTKLATSVAVLVAVEEGIVGLDDLAGPPGATVRHLLAHASGLPFDGAAPLSPPGHRRIYSNEGFEVVAAHVAEAAEMPFPEYFEHVWGFALPGSPGHGAHGPLAQLVGVAHELVVPTRVSRETLAEAAAVQFPGLAGILPGFGRYEPNDWGLGFELRDGKRPHWTGESNSEATFGHFGRSGTFLWVDPEAGIALACLTDLEFGDWAQDAWPRLADAVLAS